MEALMTENLPVFFWFGEIPGLEPILLPAISNVEARVFTSGDFRKGQFFVGGQNFAGFLARDNFLAKAPGNLQSRLRRVVPGASSQRATFRYMGVSLSNSMCVL